LALLRSQMSIRVRRPSSWFDLALLAVDVRARLAVADHLPVSLPSVADVAHLPAEQLPALLAGLAALQAAAAARLLTASPPVRNGHEPADRLLPVEQAARIAGLTREQILRRVAFKPALVKLGHRTIRVDVRKLHDILTHIGD